MTGTQIIVALACVFLVWFSETRLLASSFKQFVVTVASVIFALIMVRLLGV